MRNIINIMHNIMNFKEYLFCLIFKPLLLLLLVIVLLS
ncbi:hypothetical protein GARC_2888 [Paraglaciecola arctica BSs20135]|uniref:Uncharacterized protein n=1 Tax=Paraglaciecola arctica BSs20135 TaxID=493475 RepID=K6Y7E9_9ALTE|nr:hypothetical protein GARC_2888 [Paraglaciecola arctica BSs20135]